MIVRLALRNSGIFAIKGGPETLRQQRPALTNNRIRGAIMAKPIPTDIPDDVKARFWAKVDMRGANECWRWLGAVSSRGYGGFSFKKSGQTVTIRAHRLSYFLSATRQPGDCLDHLCRNRLCVNPRHLEAVTVKENNLRGTSPPAANASKTFCVNGHRLDGENLIIVKARGRSAARRCRTCQNRNQREWKKRLAVRAALKEIDDA